MARALVYPQRKRCRTCRKFWPEPAKWGMYCSNACAGRPEEVELHRAPRECFQPYGKGGTRKRSWKAKFASREEARDVAYGSRKQGYVTTLYVCDHCGFLHIGHHKLKVEDIVWPV